MPFVRILWKPEVTGEDVVVALRDAAPAIVGAALVRYDPEHCVTDEMVDVRVEVVGPLDRINPDLMISVYVRQEPARSEHRSVLAAQMTEGFARSGLPERAMVELLLTERACTYEYGR